MATEYTGASKAATVTGAKVPTATEAIEYTVPKVQASQYTGDKAEALQYNGPTLRVTSLRVFLRVFALRV